MAEWIEHDGKGMPVNGNALVAVKFRDHSPYYEGLDKAMPAKEWNGLCSNDSCWVHNGTDGDIIAYRLASTDKEGE